MKDTKIPFTPHSETEYYPSLFSTQTELRWWMAAGTHTNETIVNEINAMYNAGFSGVELCQLSDKNIHESVYGYGSAQWENDVKLILHTALDLGMSVSLTSGAGWSTANVPGLDPDSQQANQCIVLLTEELHPGETRQGKVPSDSKLRQKNAFLGAVAWRKCGKNVYSSENYTVLTSQVQDGCLTWTAPADGEYTVMYYFSQGTAQSASPAVQKSYTINYFDRRGVEALQTYLEDHVLNDEEIQDKIRAGNVQYFMDSLEYDCGDGITNWTEDFEDRFRKQKGYDILPFMFLAADAPSTSIWGWDDDADLIGIYKLTDEAMNKKILNDIFDVQTKLYLEEFIIPFCQWLHTKGITLRAQISYGKNLEISEPIRAVDHPEAENRNQKNQIDMYRLWSGGAHMQNKILSAETGGLDNSSYYYTYQRHLQEAYTLYSAGFSRIVWHIWAAEYGPVPVWPGYEGGDGMDVFYKFGTREPSYSDYTLFNDHLGRVQRFLRQGKAGVDLGMLYTRYGQHMVYANLKDWMHTHEPMFFPSVTLQDHGYTYDYINPVFLREDTAQFDQENKTLELAGYKALVLWQPELTVSGADTLISLAKKGMCIIVVEGAAAFSPYYGENSDILAEKMDMLTHFPNVHKVPNADDVLRVLRELEIEPYTGFTCPNQQILTQTRRDGCNQLIFAYNYCNGSLHTHGNMPHGDVISTEFIVKGNFTVKSIDPWTGKIKMQSCRHADGKTIFPVCLEADNVALFLLEPADCLCDITVPSHMELAPIEIMDWKLTVESWLPSDEILTRTETLLGINTSEYAYKTAKNSIRVSLPHLIPWDEIESIGKHVSGKGFYRASFPWDGLAAGAYLDFGKITESIRVKINGKYTDNVNMNVPRVDISTLLIPGSNTIEVEYSSNLNNLQLTRGKVCENILVNRFLGYQTGYESYGLRQALLVPYIVS